ncbi:MAG TPA: hypothetical protein VIV58_21445 [Kofleriaceae bacterium]
MRRLIGFAVCLVVGALLSLIALSARVLWAFPHETTTDSRADARWIAIGAVGFALLCDGVRARVVRSPRIPRAIARSHGR